MWLLHPITVHSFFMAATPSVLPCISGTDCKNGYREGRLVLMFCSHKGKWLFVTRDVGPPWQVSVCIAGRAWTALQSSLRWQVHIPPCLLSDSDIRHVVELWKRGHTGSC